MAKGPKRDRVSRDGGSAAAEPEGAVGRRVIRSRYLAVKNQICDESEEFARLDCDKFRSIINEVENLHHQVHKPREQVADAETLLDIANALVTSVKSHTNGGVTPSDFVTALLKNFGQRNGGTQNLALWTDVGLLVSHVFRKSQGCSTMIGPLNTEIKQRKFATGRKLTRPTERTRPEELIGTGEEGKTDTDENMSIMFGVLRKKRSVRLEHLVLNGASFAQTVENIFALSFLVKDGRAAITISEDGHHLVSPKNAPSATTITSGDVSYSHLVFRFDFSDWKLMKNIVKEDDELMPCRTRPNIAMSSQHANLEADVNTSPIKKLTRNHGLVTQQLLVDNHSLEKKVS